MILPLRLRRVVAVLTLVIAAVGTLPTAAVGGPVDAAPPECAHPDGGDFTCTGKILIGQPSSGVLGGISEYAAPPCGSNATLDGLDSRWIELPESAPGRAASLTFESPGDADLVVNFYDSTCVFIAATSMWEAARNMPEHGYVPYRAAYAAVTAKEGQDITFTFAVFTSQAPVYEPDLPRVETESEPFSVVVGADDEDRPVELRGHIYKPLGAGPFATVLSMIPYWNAQFGPSETQATEGTQFSLNYRYLVDAGFAVALVNLRGTGDSDGDCWHWGDATDVTDVGKVIEALAALPWSNGKVGMYGQSYGGWSAMMGLASRAPSLAAVAAASPVIDPLSLYSLRGVMQFPQFAVVAKGAIIEGQSVPAGSEPLRSLRPDCVSATGPDSTLNDIDHQPPVWNGDRTAFYEEVDLRSKIEGSTVPAFVANGLISPSAVTLQGEPHILQIEGLWELLPNLRLLLGQWGHEWPTRLRPDYPASVVAWFNEHLYDGPKVIEAGVAEYQDDGKQWRFADHWPLKAEERWLLSNGRLVKHEDDVIPSTQSFVGIGSPCLRICLDELGEPAGAEMWFPGPASPTCIPNNVAYISEPLEEDIEMAGNFSLDMKLSSTLPDGNLYAYLIETDAIDCSDPDARIVARATADLRHIRTEDGELFPIGEPTGTVAEAIDVTMLSLPFATKVSAGKRLVLAIGGDGREGMGMPDPWRPLITIHTGDPESGALWLPAVVEPPIGVQIDIKPGSDENPINTNSGGSIPVAILTTGSFHAPDSVDVASVRFGPSGAEATGSGVEDANGDGHPDLVLHFDQEETGLSVDHTEACLEGSTHDGRKLRGCDRVSVR